MHTAKRSEGPNADDQLLAKEFVDVVAKSTAVVGDIRVNTDRCNLLWEHEQVHVVARWLLAQQEFVVNLTAARKAALQSYIGGVGNKT